MKQEFRTKIERRDIAIFGNPFKYSKNRNCEDPQCDEVIVVWSLNYELREWGVKSVDLCIEAFEFDVYTDDYSTDGDPTNDLSGQTMYFSNKCDKFEIEFFDSDELIAAGYIGGIDIDFDNMKIQF